MLLIVALANLQTLARVWSQTGDNTVLGEETHKQMNEQTTHNGDTAQIRYILLWLKLKNGRLTKEG